MQNFNYWYNEVADMPARENGEWVDLETGHTYQDWLSSSDQKPRFKANDKTLNARNIAKSFGGKALKGTVKQKAWAEQIRAKVLESVGDTQAEILCYLTRFTTAKFWIENRNMEAKKIGENAEKAAELLKKINKTLQEAEKSLIVDKNRTIIDRTKYDQLMSERDSFIEQYDKLFA